MIQTIQFGIDNLLANSAPLRQKRLGLVTNDAATTNQLLPTRKALLNQGLDLQLLFSPEHGLQAIGTDGEAMPHTTDYLTGLPVYSLYGDNLAPTIDLLKQLDLLLFDLPDVGSRFYTYIWTLSYALEACSNASIPLVVLDRPNPISGNLHLAEGPMLNEARLSSFVGRWAIPVRHSLTIGEIARYWQLTRNLTIDLQIIPVSGWQRQQFIHETGLPFIPTSPAITTAETTLLYPALCFLEGTNVSEGRGTAYPFRICGSPWADGVNLAAMFNALQLPGVLARTIFFTPLEGKFAHQQCQGIMLHITDYRAFRPVVTGLLLIHLLKEIYPAQFAWNPYPTHVNQTGANHFDLLTGDVRVRHLIESTPSLSADSLNQLITAKDWAEKVAPALRYQ